MEFLLGLVRILQNGLRVWRLEETVIDFSITLVNYYGVCISQDYCVEQSTWMFALQSYAVGRECADMLLVVRQPSRLYN